MNITIGFTISKAECRLLDEALRQYVDNRVVNFNGTAESQAEIDGAKRLLALAQAAVQAVWRYDTNGNY